MQHLIIIRANSFIYFKYNMTIHFAFEITPFVRRLALASFSTNSFLFFFFFLLFFSDKVSLELVQVDRFFELIPLKINKDGSAFGEQLLY